MVAGLEDLVTDEGGDGGDQACLHARGGQDALGQGTGGCFAVSAGDADDSHFAAGEIVEGGGEECEGYTPVVDVQVGKAVGQGYGQSGEWQFAGYGYRTSLQRGRDVEVTVGVAPAAGQEKRAWFYAAGVLCHSGDLYAIKVARRPGEGAPAGGQAVKQCLQANVWYGVYSVYGVSPSFCVQMEYTIGLWAGQ